GNTDIADGRWHYVAASFSRDSELEIYVDGVKDGSVSITDMQDINISSSNPLRIGTSSYNPNQSSYFYIGEIDEVKIYNYARTQEQILEDMYGGHPIESVENPVPKVTQVFGGDNEDETIIDGAGAPPIAHWSF